MKSFEVKLYSRVWLFKKTINPRNIVSEINFSEELNWWQSDMNLEVIWDFWDFLSTDIIEIREVDEENKVISPTYTWVIEEISLKEYVDWDTISLQVLWLATVLNDNTYKTWGNRVFTSNLTVWNLVKSIIDSFNADYWTLSWWNTQNLDTNLIRYTVSSIDVSWSLVNISFDNDSCFDAIKKAIENTDFSFWIWADWICYLQKDTWQTWVSLTLWRQVLLVDRKIHKRDLTNYLYHERAWSNEQTYTDPVSISLFWKKEKKIVDSEIQDATTQNIKWNKYIEDYAYERNEIQVTIKPQKSDSIVPWNMLSINNVKVPILNKKITKISKSKDSWTISLWDFISFWNTVLKK